MIDLRVLQRALDGDISNGQLLCPGPGHSNEDRSLSVKLDEKAPGGFIVHSFADDDPIACVSVLDKLVKAARVEDDDGADTDDLGKKQADVLIALARETSLFHTPPRDGYADIVVHGHRETHKIRSRSFRAWLAHRYFKEREGAPSSEAMQSALNVIEARALFEGNEMSVHVRVAGHDGKLYLDLADEQWRAIEIDTDGWRIIPAPPVRFRRAPGMLPLPEPKAGGAVGQLRAFLNVKSDDDFELALAWLLAAMRDRGPYPVLALMGEQGSAKTSFATILRLLVDPSTAPLRSFPREDRDLFIAASNGWIVGYDNVSRVPSWLSDALCRLATGGGFSTRKLYTDDEEQLFNAQRPAVLNGIEDFVGRPDLADRTIFLTLEPIPEERRKADQALQDEINQVRPQILGALLNLVVVGLQRLPHIRLECLPRMADFALWGSACERMPGAFLRAYEENRKSAVETILAADLVATAIQALTASRREWKGTASHLLDALEGVVGEKVVKSKNWPASAEALGRGLRRPATFLRKAGIEISFKKIDGARTIIITRNPLADWVGKEPSQPSHRPKPNKTDGLGGDSNRDRSPEQGEEPSLELSRANPLTSDGKDSRDSRDSRDGKIPTQSGRPLEEEPCCRRCGIPATEVFGPLVRCGRDGAAGLYHRRCWTDERTRGSLREVPPDRRPALGPLGDSLDDFQ